MKKPVNSFLYWSTWLFSAFFVFIAYILPKYRDQWMLDAADVIEADDADLNKSSADPVAWVLAAVAIVAQIALMVATDKKHRRIICVLQIAAAVGAMVWRSIPYRGPSGWW